MSKRFDDPRLESELNEMLDSISRIKSPEYGMIVRTVFNVHNLISFSSNLLAQTGRVSVEDMKTLDRQNENAVADMTLTLFKLYFLKDTTPDRAIALSHDLEADLAMLLAKQSEYNKE